MRTSHGPFYDSLSFVFLRRRRRRRMSTGWWHVVVWVTAGRTRKIITFPRSLGSKGSCSNYLFRSSLSSLIILRSESRSIPSSHLTTFVDWGRRLNGFLGLSLNVRTIFSKWSYWIRQSQSDKTVFALRRSPWGRERNDDSAWLTTTDCSSTPEFFHLNVRHKLYPLRNKTGLHIVLRVWVQIYLHCIS